MTFIGHLLGYFGKHEAIKILKRSTPTMYLWARFLEKNLTWGYEKIIYILHEIIEKLPQFGHGARGTHPPASAGVGMDHTMPCRRP